MCVILVSPGPKARPTRPILDACHEANPHGAGLAWREGRRVRWMKNLDVDDAHALLAELTGEVVIHFRWASVGGVDADLCHPFPVTATAKTDLFGNADAVLFHNGTWSQ
jgi:predicted glutamine amidotransferase